MQIKEIENRLREFADKIFRLNNEQISFTSIRNVKVLFDKVTRQKSRERNYRKIQREKGKT